MNRTGFKLLFVVLMLCSIRASAQSFTATVNNTTVGQNDQFQVSFTFSGNSVNGIKNFNPPAFSNFMVLSGPNQSTSMQIINGAASASITYSYYLQPKSVGKFTIGTASIENNGNTYHTQPLSITVVKGAPKPKQNTPQSQSQPAVTNTEIGKNLFIRATSDRKRAYMGQQITVTYKLYTRLNIASQMSVSKLPSYQGFWAEEINVPNNITFTTEMYKGKQFRVGILKKAALFPSQTGELSVTPFEINVPVQVKTRQQKGNNIFDNFFNDPFFNNYRTINYDAKSNTIKIKVEPLPSANVPESFNGAVGQYSLSASLSQSHTTTNNPVDLKLVISGTGNIKLLNTPKVDLPPGFDQYQPKTNDQINRAGAISGKKTIDYLIVPRAAGKKLIPAIKFSFFDPGKRSYVTLQSKPFELTVTPGQNIAGSNDGGISKEDVKMLGNDIRYIKTSDYDIEKEGYIVLFQPGFWFAAIFPLILLGGLITWKKRNDKLAGNVQLLRYQKAQKVAKTRFKTAKNLMESNNQNGFYSEISLALFGYLEDKLRISKSEISLERAAEELQRRNINKELIDNLKDCADKCEYFRFAPKADGVAGMNEMYNNLTKVIIELEKSLR